MVGSGFYDLVVSGGVESMSRVAMGSDGGAIWDPQTQWEVGSVPQGCPQISSRPSTASTARGPTPSP